MDRYIHRRPRSKGEVTGDPRRVPEATKSIPMLPRLSRHGVFANGLLAPAAPSPYRVGGTFTLQSFTEV